MQAWETFYSVLFLIHNLFSKSYSFHFCVSPCPNFVYLMIFLLIYNFANSSVFLFLFVCIIEYFVYNNPKKQKQAIPSHIFFSLLLIGERAKIHTRNIAHSHTKGWLGTYDTHKQGKLITIPKLG